MPPIEPKILALSPPQRVPAGAMADFERAIVYGVYQMLNLYTNLTFLDYATGPKAIPLAVPPMLNGKASEIRQMANRYQCPYIMVLSLLPEIEANHLLKAVTIELQLFDIPKGTCALHVSYPYASFEDIQPKATAFTPTWDGLQNIVYWIVHLLLQTIQPEQAMTLCKPMHTHFITQNFRYYQTLLKAHYTGTNGTGQDARLTLLQSLIADDPHSVVGHLELGLCYKQQRQYENATRFLQSAFTLMKQASARQRAICATEIGVCHALSQATEKATDWWKIAIFEDPTWANPYMNLAHALEDQGKTDEAENYFRQANEMAPGDSRTYLNLARLYSKEEQWDKAVVQYEQISRLEPDNAWAYSNIANCYLQQGHIVQAKFYLQKTVSIDPEGEAGRCANLILSGLEAADG